MLIAEIIALCALFFGVCYINTGSDEKNIRSFSSYPDTVQSIIKENPILSEKIKPVKPVMSFISNIVVFGIILFIFGLFIKQKSFGDNFIKLLILGQSLNAFDFLIIDMLWWRNSKRIRFTGTEDMNKIYRSPRKHLISFLKGIFLFLIIAVIDGFLLSLI